MKTKKAEMEINDPKNQIAILQNKTLWELRSACWNNAVRLIKDSEILLKSNRLPSSFFMSYTALEELGKYLFVCDYITGIVSEQEFKDAFTDHKLKVAYAHNNAELTKLDNGSYKATIVYDKSKFHEWMIYRNNSMYIGCDDQLNITIPENEITEELTLKMLERAKKEMEDIESLEYISERIGSKAFYK